MKFGGSSVRDAAQIKKIAALIVDAHRQSKRLAVVVSAMEGTTDKLIAMGEKASAGRGYDSDLQALKERHLTACKELAADQAEGVLQPLFEELSDLLHGVALVGELSPRTLDLIMSMGERLSAPLVAEAVKKLLPQAMAIDARSWITTNSSHGSALVDFKTTNPKISNFFETEKEALPIVTGFIAATKEGITTTLGRGGSDLTASIVGAAVGADLIEIWTDVDGVMTADPRKVRQAFPIPALTYNEMMELSHFGAKVVHPPTLTPAMRHKIPIKIKNSFNPAAPGTLITEGGSHLGSPICGISSIDNVALLRLEGSGMVGVCGVATRLFNALAQKQINVIIISQGSSEHSICFAVAPRQSDQAKEAIEAEFALEMQALLVDPVVVEKEVSIIAIVGENMCRTPGISGRFFSALGRNGINVAAIAQGSSELNITCVVGRPDETKALNVIHDAFFLSDATTLHLFLAGTGLIGSALLKLIEQQREKLREEYNLKISFAAIANSKAMVFDKMGVAPSDLEKRGEPMEVPLFIAKMRECNLANSIFVDCTASETIADCYEELLKANISIVTPNKKANAGPYARYNKLKAVAKERGVRFLYEANVGAALPILGTLIDLIRTGDKIEKIEGVLSGTLSYIFNNFTGKASFSEVVKEAQRGGFTEPDPRDDLNAMDLARKLLILARECGLPLELEQVVVEPLLPAKVFAAPTLEAFYSSLDEGAAPLAKKKEEAEAAGKRLRYIASLEGGRAAISLRAVGADHPFYSLSGSDNIIAITTARYHSSPLVIKGAGAGAEVTAGEVFSGIIKAGGS